jgi:pimeloyl-ACP methyl ester carboxylesterase
MLRQMALLADRESRASFLATIDAVINVGGQRVSATDRLHLAGNLPTLIVWGERDRMIPVAHARAAAELIEGCRLDVVPGAGHYPHEDEPERFARTLADFVATTTPTRMTSRELARRLAERSEDSAT